jgi:hypothetical protein
MKCGEARFALAADPSHVAAAVAEHVGTCEPCAAYARDMSMLDDRLREAMNVSAPEITLPAGPHLAASAPPRRQVLRQFALAASVAGVALLVGMLWIGVPRQSLASAVVAHMSHEPDALVRTEPMSVESVAPVLARSGVQLRDGMPGISYAHSCWFRGRHVPHLVVQTPGGPVTIMVLPDEKTDGRVVFAEEGYQGMVVPAQQGSIAVLARDGEDLEAVVNQALAALTYAD